ncbi:CheR family methyltransferase [Acidovorax facilis]|uniref:CheR family methyltransferase n=1 Tax=Acidovorax facilis TaxID=12917 RepID=UPI003CEEE0F9
MQITANEFSQLRNLIYRIAGIHLSDAKRVLLVGRLSKRLRELHLRSFTEYFHHVTKLDSADELQLMVDLLTTNETYFFREPEHFNFLQALASRHRASLGGGFRVWSAASSTGEEAYSIAMVLADTMGSEPWEVVGTDISTQVLVKAERGHYTMDRISGIPQKYLKKYCLKGMREQHGTMLLCRELRERVHFLQSNLLNPEQGLGKFDVVFLRNVLIYFDNPTKSKVISNLIPFLKSDGHFIVGHSETISGITDSLTAIQPTIYRQVHR